MYKPVAWFNQTSLPMVRTRNRNGQLVIPIPKKSAEKHKLKPDMDVHVVIFWRTKAIHKGEMKNDEVMPILKKKDYIRFKRWKKDEDEKVSAILKSVDSPLDLNDKEMMSIEITLGKEAVGRIKQLKKDLNVQEEELKELDEIDELEELDEIDETEEIK